MAFRTLSSLVAICLWLPLDLAFALPAADVFQSASASVVVIYGHDAKGKKKSQGSGVVLPDRAVITNCHVLKDASRYTVSYGGRDYPASLRHSDWDRDVCSLAVPGLNARSATLGSTRTLRVGQRVYAIGAPQGLELTLSEGVVSSLRELESGRYVQTTAPISPGSSGGGLFDEEGRLIGLTTFYRTDGQQLNFAFPVEWVVELPGRSIAQPSPGPSATGWLSRAIDLATKKDWPALLEHCLRWTRAQPSNAIGWFSLGVAYGTTDQPAKAIEAYQQALRINPEHADAWTSLGNAYGKTGQLAKAIEAYQQALRINPEDADAWTNLGNAYGNTGQPAKAIEAFQQALRINPEDARAWTNLGAAYGMTDQPAKAIEAYQQALRINPEYANAWFGLGFSYKTVGRRAEVMELYRRLKELSPELADKFFSTVILP